MWDGMTLSRVVALLARGRLRVSPRRVHLAYFMLLGGMVNSAAAALQRLVHGRRIAGTPLVAPPVIVIGHWRSGTTLLHELLVLDDRFGYPTTLQAFAPEHHLITRHLRRLIEPFVPRQRPTDEMPLGIERPQEDEFALLALGLPTPYASVAFPNQPRRDLDNLDFRTVPPATRDRVMGALNWFLQGVTVHWRRPLVLKNPVHLGRTRSLRALWPGCRFVHIVRDPYEVFPSTLRRQKALHEAEGLQEPHHRGLEEAVLTGFERLYAAFEADRDAIPAGHLAEVRFEDLVADPVAELRRVYDELDLGGFERVRPAIEEYFVRRRDYRRARYPRDLALEARIDRRWGPWMARYGYGPRSSDPRTPALSATGAGASTPRVPRDAVPS